ITAPKSIPAAESTPGWTKMMYAIARKVTAPRAARPQPWCHARGAGRIAPARLRLPRIERLLQARSHPARPDHHRCRSLVRFAALGHGCLPEETACLTTRTYVGSITTPSSRSELVSGGSQIQRRAAGTVLIRRWRADAAAPACTSGRQVMRFRRVLCHASALILQLYSYPVALGQESATPGS